MTAIKTKITVHGVPARAHRGPLDALLTHASADGGTTALCPAEDPLCDAVEPGPPTCKRCAVAYRRAVAS